MTSKDVDKFKNYMTLFSEVYKREVSSSLISLYWESFKDYDFGAVESAFKKHLATSKFFPLPADIIELLDGSKDDLDTQAEIAYNKVIDARKSYGAYKTVIFDDPVIHRVIEQHGGWISICHMSYEDEQYTAFKKNFIQEYKSFSKASDKAIYNYPTKLVGITEAENSSNAYDAYIPEPAYIGDANKAIEWTNKIKQLKAERQEAVKGKVVDMGEIKAIADLMAV